ncbi:FAD-binding protein [bacterium]|nr:FAD-binding protein [bacterium]
MKPENEAELSEMVRAAAGPLSLRGGGTRGLAYGSGAVLETGGVAGIRLYEPGALTLVAGAGTPLDEVESVLAGERQRLAFEVPDMRAALGRDGISTLGGVAAMNASGPRRVQAGAARDHMIGLRFVDGMGTVVKSGGRVMKNVTGLDLVKLLAGSQGTLGVITEVAFKVQAIPETEVTLQAEVGRAAGLALLRQALGSPFEVSGAACGSFGAVLRIEGMAASVRYRAAALKALLGGDWAEIDGSALWAGIRDGGALGAGALWRVSVKPTEAERVVAALTGVQHEATFDWGGGLIWIAVQGRADGGAALIRGAVAGVGHATLVRGPAGVPVFQPEAAGVAALSTALRAKFDPRGILNAGIFDQGAFG